MKFKIKHEITGRIRIHMDQKKMTYQQADTLLYYLNDLPGVQEAKVYERTADAMIVYTGNRADLIKSLKVFTYDSVEVPDAVLANSGRELNAVYQEKLMMKVLMRAGSKLFIPAPEPQNGYCNIVAARSGYIERIDPLWGDAMAEPGDYVKKGQILIRGQIPIETTTFDENAPKEYYVRARGEVWARVPYRLTFRQERYLRSAQVERAQTGAYAAQSGQAAQMKQTQSEDAQSGQAAQPEQAQSEDAQDGQTAQMKQTQSEDAQSGQTAQMEQTQSEDVQSGKAAQPGQTQTENARSGKADASDTQGGPAVVSNRVEKTQEQAKAKVEQQIRIWAKENLPENAEIVKKSLNFTQKENIIEVGVTLEVRRQIGKEQEIVFGTEDSTQQRD